MTDIMKNMNDRMCAKTLKVLADQTRIAVVQELLKKPMHVNEINTRIDIDQSLLSHHLSVLRKAGIVSATRDGKAVLYQLTPEISAKSPGTKIDLGCCQLSFN